MENPIPSKLTFFEHLEEFRGLVLRCVSVLLLGCIAVGCAFPYFADLMYYPLRIAVGSESEALQGLVTTSPMGIFSVLIQVCFLGGLALSLPFMIYFAARFVAPGLNRRERGILLPTCIAILMLFLIGASFSYFYVIPASLGISIDLNKMFGFQLIWSASTYYGLVVWMTLGIGLCFEFPLGILLLIYLNVLSTSKLKAIRKHMVVVVLVAAGFITPTSDPLSLMMLAVPLYVLYELAILAGGKIEAKRAKVSAAEEAELDWN